MVDDQGHRHPTEQGMCYTVVTMLGLHEWRQAVIFLTTPRLIAVLLGSLVLLAGCGSTPVRVPAFTATPTQTGVALFALPEPDGDLGSLIPGPDGALWFTESDASQPGRNAHIGRITFTGQIKEFPLPIQAGAPLEMTFGPDGALWFTLYQTGAIGRMTTSGVLTTFPLPYGGSTPAWITSGPDGNLWFSDTTRHALGRLSPATGAIQEFPISGAPSGLTIGRDGNLWFADNTGSFIGRFSLTTQAIQTFSLGPARFPVNLLSGPDGSLWFVEPSLNQIGRLTPTGDLHEYLIPTPQGDADALVCMPDGTLWFTEPFGSRIGQLTPTAGVIREFPLPATLGFPTEMTSGPNDTLWVSVLRDGRRYIARMQFELARERKTSFQET